MAATVLPRVWRSCAKTCPSSTLGSARAMRVAFDHNVRSAQGKKSQARIAGGQQVQPPAHIVHGDYTLTGAPQRLRDLAAPPRSNDTLQRFLAAGESLIPASLAERALSADSRFAII